MHARCCPKHPRPFFPEHSRAHLPTAEAQARAGEVLIWEEGAVRHLVIRDLPAEAVAQGLRGQKVTRGGTVRCEMTDLPLLASCALHCGPISRRSHGWKRINSQDSSSASTFWAQATPILEKGRLKGATLLPKRSDVNQIPRLSGGPWRTSPSPTPDLLLETTTNTDERPFHLWETETKI